MNLVEKFTQRYKGLAKHMVNATESFRRELIVDMDDGSRIIYDDRSEMFRNAPSDPNKLTIDECKNEFGIRLRNILEEKNVTQKELSEKTDISPILLSQYINGRVSPSFHNVDKIAKALNLDMNELRYL